MRTKIYMYALFVIIPFNILVGQEAIVDPFQGSEVSKLNDYDNIRIIKEELPEILKRERQERFRLAQKNNLVLQSNIEYKDKLLLHIFGVWNTKIVNMCIVSNDVNGLKAASNENFLAKLDLKVKGHILDGSFFLYDVITERRIASDVGANLKDGKPVLLGYFTFDNENKMDDYILVWVQL